jgi:putative transcriptional regulator
MSRKRESLINLRLKKKLTQKEASEKIGISRSFLAEIENGDKNPSFKTMQKFINFYGEKTKDIFFNPDVA